MAVSPEFKAYVQELFAPFGKVELKRMFGGAGIYLGDTIFGLVIAGDTIHLKTDETTRPDFVRESCTPFSYAHPKKGVVETSYWTLPAHLYDDGEELARWSAKARAVSQLAKTDGLKRSVTPAARRARKRS